MACKKSELVSGINSLVSAMSTSDAFLRESAATRLQGFIDSLDFAPEEVEEDAAEGEG